MRLIAHSGGIGWDEAVIFVLPVVVLVVLQVLGRRKRDPGVDPPEDGDGGDGGDQRGRAG